MGDVVPFRPVPKASHVQAMRRVITRRSTTGVLVPSPGAIARLVSLATSGERVPFDVTLSKHDAELWSCSWLEPVPRTYLLQVRSALLDAFFAEIGGVP